MMGSVEDVYTAKQAFNLLSTRFDVVESAERNFEQREQAMNTARIELEEAREAFNEARERLVELVPEIVDGFKEPPPEETVVADPDGSLRVVPAAFQRAGFDHQDGKRI